MVSRDVAQPQGMAGLTMVSPEFGLEALGRKALCSLGHWRTKLLRNNVDWENEIH